MLLAERLGARSWPAAVAWASVFPAVFILEVVLWGSGAPGPPQITFVGAFVAASVLLVNRWYFPKVELFFAGAQSDRQVPLLSGSRSQKAMARGDLAAIILWILLSLSANLYDWEGGNFCWFPNSGSLRLWGCFVSGLSRIGYVYLYLAGLSLLVHYSGIWMLMGKSIRDSQPPSMPASGDRTKWAEWHRAWASYCEKLKSRAELFFIGFISLLAVVITATWAWIFFTSLGWTTILHPLFLASDGFVVVALIIYRFGPSIAAWQKVEKAQKNLRQKAYDLLSQDGSERYFPSLSATLMSMSNDPVLSFKHGTPRVAIAFFLSYLAGFIIRSVLGA